MTEAMPVSRPRVTESPQALGDLAVVVVNFGAHDLLISNLLPLARSWPGLRIVVVDNYSSVEEAARVQLLASAEGWRAVMSSTNVGFGAGTNRGVGVAIAEGAARILLLNPDAWIERGSVEKLDAVVRVDLSAVVMPTILNPDGSLHFAGADLLLDSGDMRSSRRRPQQHVDRYVPWLSAACLMTSAELWTRVGGFDEGYFLYWEDVDLSVRAQSAGGRLVVLDEATAVHSEGSTHRDSRRNPAEAAKSSTYYYYNTRNRLVFAAKNLDRQDQRRWLRRSLPAGYRILSRGGRRQFLRPWGPVKAAASGTLAGSIALSRTWVRRGPAK